MRSHFEWDLFIDSAFRAGRVVDTYHPPREDGLHTSPGLIVHDWWHQNGFDPDDLYGIDSSWDSDKAGIWAKFVVATDHQAMLLKLHFG